MKLCSKCDIDKPDEDFRKGSGNHCLACRNEYSRQYKRKHPEKVVQEREWRAAYNKEYRRNHTDYYYDRAESKRRFCRSVKLAAGCMDCGYTDHVEALDFDHRPGEVKLFTLNQVGWRPLITIVKEMMKCDVVCANCHRVRTSNRRIGVK